MVASILIRLRKLVHGVDFTTSLFLTRPSAISQLRNIARPYRQSVSFKYPAPSVRVRQNFRPDFEYLSGATKSPHLDGKFRRTMRRRAAFEGKGGRDWLTTIMENPIFQLSQSGFATKRSISLF
ncbi:hypothetical protein TWF225_000619 [Orbilia oligospora]|uniref:Uncharacterized protein n=1 Tax=Orbilia oligospora TaxID=2813651 RepID=A0A8H2DLD0_ORBOL|nr:hypothetical protein TWF225_000619 [Orbilia oligospora]KAF3264696.1 hypothetical protein TWF128_001148 [Orbilia oligospora]KAF3268480.1 hypothetical protein TWF217_011065 [Orbilia oligospora]KAF3280354.1 hypothetical protein TWF132_011814 [Orbilia oligospora]TGJ62560.1 hypothetical protein EYR41_011751 [Orbilia oligospora]